MEIIETVYEPTFWEFFKGQQSDSEFLFSVFLVFFGILIYTIVRIRRRQDKDKNASLKIWWNCPNNRFEMLLSLLLIWPQVLFYPVYSDWIMGLMPETFKAVPHFVILASGYFQHYGIVQLVKNKKKNGR